jgi:AraC-like DNA-binding protein
MRCSHRRSQRIGRNGHRGPKLAQRPTPPQNLLVNASPVARVPRGVIAPAVAALVVDERDRDTQGVAIPRPEVHLVVRFGPSAKGGLDVHAMGGRKRVLRKLVHGGQRTVMARLHLGAAAAALGVPASALVGRAVPLEDLWGAATTRRLLDELASARGTREAAAILQSAICEHFVMAGGQHARSQLVLEAASRLTLANVNTVATDLGVSERHLRRVFDETIGMSPKAFAQLARFRRALHAAREGLRPGWATIAASAGYYDQAHLIAEFRAIAGVTPQLLLAELRAAQSLG